MITEVNTGLDEGQTCPTRATIMWAVAAEAEKGEGWVSQRDPWPVGRGEARRVRKTDILRYIKAGLGGEGPFCRT